MVGHGQGPIFGRGQWVFSDPNNTQIPGGPATDGYIRGLSWAKAMRGWFYAFGRDALVDGIWKWLMSFQDDPRLMAAAGNPTGDVLHNTCNLGVFNPKLALTKLLQVKEDSAPVAKNGALPDWSCIYEWATTGLLAPFQSVSDNASFSTAKDTLDKDIERIWSVIPTLTRSYKVDFIVLRSRTGLSFQSNENTDVFLDTAEEVDVYVSLGLRTIDIERCAMLGAAYRFEPKIFVFPEER